MCKWFKNWKQSAYVGHPESDRTVKMLAEFDRLEADRTVTLMEVLKAKQKKTELAEVRKAELTEQTAKLPKCGTKTVCEKCGSSEFSSTFRAADQRTKEEYFYHLFGWAICWPQSYDAMWSAQFFCEAIVRKCECGNAWVERPLDFVAPATATNSSHLIASVCRMSAAPRLNTGTTAGRPFKGDIMDIRKHIEKRLAEIGWTVGKLTRAVQSAVPATTIYEFMSEKSSMNSEALGHVLDAIGFSLEADGEPLTDEAIKRRARKN